ncbi:MAG: ribonuclease III [Desulfobacterales bacterium]|nr:MAG: ribonuclease III [Desulfobacterales bacterium]
MTEFASLEDSLEYHFSDPRLLEQACRHRSWLNEHLSKTTGGRRLEDNERMEFLGDAVLNLSVSHLLMDRYPDLDEGCLSRMRAGLVNEASLSRMAGELDLGRFLLLGKGEALNQGRRKDSILSDTFEAVIAAVYIDGGFAAAFSLVERRFARAVARSRTDGTGEDHKSRLQEYLQMRRLPVPSYSVAAEKGPDHDKTFTVEISIPSANLRLSADGKSKKRAEQAAAARALSLLEKKD